MHCTCNRARREARAEAFRDAAEWHRAQARDFMRDFGPEDDMGTEHRDCAAHFDTLAAEASPTRPEASPATPVRYSEAPEATPSEKAASEPSYDLRGYGEKLRAAYANARNTAIVDCVEEDGFITVYPPLSWGPSDDGGLDG